MGGPKLEVLIMEFNAQYEKFIGDNRYGGFTPAVLHAKAMAYARDHLPWPITHD